MAPFISQSAAAGATPTMTNTDAKTFETATDTSILSLAPDAVFLLKNESLAYSSSCHFSTGLPRTDNEYHPSFMIDQAQTKDSPKIT
jgi:hypothetical protein